MLKYAYICIKYPEQKSEPKNWNVLFLDIFYPLTENNDVIQAK